MTAAPPPALSPGSLEYVLSLADDEHMIGARHTSWIGLGPFLEEDLAFCSIAQDELGHAIALYEVVLADSARSETELDAFAMLRAPGDYRSCHLAERACSEWSDSLVRHWLYDRAEALRWEALAESSDRRLAAIAARALRDEAFHTAHAERFMRHVSPSRPQPLLASITDLLPIAVAMWDPVAGETDAVAEGVTTATSAELAERWELAVRSDLAEWNLDIAWPSEGDVAGVVDAQDHRTGRSTGFGSFQAELRTVIDVDPTAKW